MPQRFWAFSASLITLGCGKNWFLQVHRDANTRERLVKSGWCGSLYLQSYEPLGVYNLTRQASPAENMFYCVSVQGSLPLASFYYAISFHCRTTYFHACRMIEKPVKPGSRDLEGNIRHLARQIHTRPFALPLFFLSPSIVWYGGGTSVQLHASYPLSHVASGTAESSIQ